MGQVRTAVHASAGAPPAEVLARTNRLLTDLDPGLFTSCLYVHLDLAGHRALLATAGHPPPLLHHPGGHTEVLRLPPGLLLGIDPEATYPTTEIPLPAGAALALYTDGLVEAPGTDLDEATAPWPSSSPGPPAGPWKPSPTRSSAMPNGPHRAATTSRCSSSRRWRNSRVDRGPRAGRTVLPKAPLIGSPPHGPQHRDHDDRRSAGAGDPVRPSYAAQLDGRCRTVPARYAPRDPGPVRAGHGRAAEYRAGRPAAGRGRLLAGRRRFLQRTVPARGTDARLPPPPRGRADPVGGGRRRLPAAGRGRVGARVPGRHDAGAVRPPRRHRLVSRQLLERPHEVGGRLPNDWGLYDTLGNVWEWCWDVYDAEVYGSYRVLRGGGWFDEHWSCRASVRRRSHPTFGSTTRGSASPAPEHGRASVSRPRPGTAGPRRSVRR